MSVSRHGIAVALEEIARYLELSEENQFRAIAYRRAARGIERAEGDLEALAKAGELTSISGVGKGIAPIVGELIETGRSRYLDELRAKYPPGIFQLLRVPNLGLKKIEKLFSELGIANLADLERACSENRLQKLKGFGKKTEQNICEGIASMREQPSRWLLPKVLGAAQRLSEVLADMRGVERVEMTRELRRRLETVATLELCVVSPKPDTTAKQIAALDILGEATQSGPEVRAYYREYPVVIHLTDEPSFAALLFRTTGSEEFVDAIERAAEKADVAIDAMRDEEQLFRDIGFRYVAPELRESAPVKSKIPRRLIERDDILGTFHIHSTYSDGKNTLYEMLDAAQERGFTYVGMSDHSKTAGYAGGLTEARVAQHQAELEKLKSSFESLRIFKGSEVDILLDGALDYGRETLSTFDFIVASIHSRFKMEKDEMTERMCRALANPFVTFLGHLTGRLLLSRPGYSLDFDRVFETAAKNGVMIEINANPHRLDIDWRLMRRALDAGVIFCINPDAHSTDEYDHMISGIWHARKGGLEPKHIFNTLDVDEVADYLEKRRERAMKLTA